MHNLVRSKNIVTLQIQLEPEQELGLNKAELSKIYKQMTDLVVLLRKHGYVRSQMFVDLKGWTPNS